MFTSRHLTLGSRQHQTNSCSAFGLHLQLEAKTTMGDEELGGGNHVTTVLFIKNSGIPSINGSKAEFIKCLTAYCTQLISNYRGVLIGSMTLD